MGFWANRHPGSNYNILETRRVVVTIWPRTYRKTRQSSAKAGVGARNVNCSYLCVSQLPNETLENFPHKMFLGVSRLFLHVLNVFGWWLNSGTIRLETGGIFFFHLLVFSKTSTVLTSVRRSQTKTVRSISGPGAPLLRDPQTFLPLLKKFFLQHSSNKISLIFRFFTEIRVGAFHFCFCFLKICSRITNSVET